MPVFSSASSNRPGSAPVRWTSTSVGPFEVKSVDGRARPSYGRGGASIAQRWEAGNQPLSRETNPPASPAPRQDANIPPRPRCRRNAPDQIRSGAKSPASLRKQALFPSCPLARCLQWERARVRVCEAVGASSTEQSQPASPSRPAIEPESAEPHAPASRRRNLGPGRVRVGASAAEVAGDQIVPGFGVCDTRTRDGRGGVAGVVTSCAFGSP